MEVGNLEHDGNGSEDLCADVCLLSPPLLHEFTPNGQKNCKMDKYMNTKIIMISKSAK